MRKACYAKILTAQVGGTSNKLILVLLLNVCWLWTQIFDMLRINLWGNSKVEESLFTLITKVVFLFFYFMYRFHYIPQKIIHRIFFLLDVSTNLKIVIKITSAATRRDEAAAESNRLEICFRSIHQNLITCYHLMGLELKKTNSTQRNLFFSFNLCEYVRIYFLKYDTISKIYFFFLFIKK